MTDKRAVLYGSIKKNYITDHNLTAIAHNTSHIVKQTVLTKCLNINTYITAHVRTYLYIQIRQAIFAHCRSTNIDNNHHRSRYSCYYLSFVSAFASMRWIRNSHTDFYFYNLLLYGFEVFRDSVNVLLHCDSGH